LPDHPWARRAGILGSVLETRGRAAGQKEQGEERQRERGASGHVEPPWGPAFCQIGALLSTRRAPKVNEDRLGVTGLVPPPRAIPGPHRGRGALAVSSPRNRARYARAE